MVIETLDIVDTAVKVGLGALISGFTTYYITKLKHSEEAVKEHRRRRWELLKTALDASNEYMLALGHFFAAVDGLRRDHPEAKTIEETGHVDFVEERDQALLDAVTQRLRAFSRLTIIGEPKAAGIIDQLNELEDEMRSCVIFKNELPSNEKLESWYRQIREAKKSLLNELSKTY